VESKKLKLKIIVGNYSPKYGESIQNTKLTAELEIRENGTFEIKIKKKKRKFNSYK